jgi:predicted RNA-binding protein with PUA-like domain
MKGSMSIGDLCLFYHSNGDKKNPTGVYGVAKIISRAHPDLTAQDSKDEHYDPKANAHNPIWECVDISYVCHLKEIVLLSEIKLDPKLDGIMVAAKGSRLSIQPVSEKHFKYIIIDLGNTII